MNPRIKAIERRLEPLRLALKRHSLYAALGSVEDIKRFTEHHVYAVFDFMSLLKALQLEFTTVKLPWVPPKDPEIARFINEIVFGEESDVNESGEPMSHFEMYLGAMNQLGSNTKNITRFVESLNNQRSISESLKLAQVPDGVKAFVEHTFEIVNSHQVHKIASSFTFGREDIIPDLFISILEEAQSNDNEFSKFLYYLNRHIELDGDQHGPIAVKMIEKICKDDDRLWKEAEEVAVASLEARISLWDSISESIQEASLC